MSAPRRRILRALAIGAAFVVVIVFRVVYVSHAELGEGDHALEEDERELAVAHYRRALRWYAPLSPYPGRAITRLERLAALAEQEGDAKLALACHRSIRAGIMASRSVYTPHEEALERATAAIARLVASEPPPPMDVARDRASRQAEHERLLMDARLPALPYVLLVYLGFALFVGGALLFAGRAIGEDDRLVREEAVVLGCVIALGVVCMAFGLRFA